MAPSAPSRRRLRKHRPPAPTYKPHQRYVIDYLTHTCTRQDGLLLYHYMGSGKTFTAVGLMANLQLPTVLVAPAGLLGMWRTQYLATYKRALPTSIECYDFEGFWRAMRRKGAAWRRERLLVVDEAHNLAQWLSTKLPVDRRTSSLQALFEFKKRVLLTGTPMYWSEHDLSFLVNIARGKAAIPIDPNQFRERYFTVNKTRALFEGWVASTGDVIHKGVTTAMYTMAGTAALGALLDRQSLVKPKHVRRALTAVEAPVTAGTTLWYRGVRRACRPLVKRWTSLQMLDQLTEAKAVNANGEATRMARTHQRRYATLKHRPDLPVPQFFAYVTKQAMGRAAQVQFVHQLPYLVATLLVTWLVCFVVRQYYCRESDLELLRLDHAKLVGEMAPYVSYYAPSLVREDASSTGFGAWRARLLGAFRRGPATARRRGTRRHPTASRATATAFPAIRSVVKTVSYNHRQYRMFVRFTMGKLSFKDYAQLTVVPHERDGATTSFDQSDGANFRQYGRMIGNACTFRGGGGGGSAGYHDHLAYDPTAYAYTLRRGHAFRSVAPKFDAFLKHLKQHPGKRRVVYSNFGEASATLSAYLSARGVAHRYLRDRDGDQGGARASSEGSRASSASSASASTSSTTSKAKAKAHGGGGKQTRGRRSRKQHTPTRAVSAPTTDAEYAAVMDWVARTPDALLLLDQSYSEGISIREVDEFHLLDPCDSVAKDDQTKARVVRLDSHPPGSKVTIVEWISSLAMLANTLDWVREWFSHRAFVLFTHMLTDHKQTVTPDAVVRQEVHKLAKSTLKVMTLLRSQSVERYAREPLPARCGAAVGKGVVEVG